MNLLQKNIEWVPYFGNQRRFTFFVEEALRGLYGDNTNIVVGETNSGSHALSRMLAPKGYNFQCNDISAYSEAIGRALNWNMGWTHVENKNFLQAVMPTPFAKEVDKLVSQCESSLDAASLGSALVSLGGYDLDLVNVSVLDLSLQIARWRKWYEANRIHGTGVRFIRGDLFDFVRNSKGNVLYVDFAWPWKDGRGTEEYTDMVDLLSSCLLQEKVSFDPLTYQNIVQAAQQVVTEGLENYNYVILSNQSSNFPQPEVLEPYIEAWDLPMVSWRRLTLPAEDVDNRGLDQWFTEYQYIFGG